MNTTSKMDENNFFTFKHPISMLYQQYYNLIQTIEDAIVQDMNALHITNDLEELENKDSEITQVTEENKEDKNHENNISIELYSNSHSNCHSNVKIDDKIFHLFEELKLVFRKYREALKNSQELNEKINEKLNSIHKLDEQQNLIDPLSESTEKNELSNQDRNLLNPSHGFLLQVQQNFQDEQINPPIENESNERNEESSKQEEFSLETTLADGRKVTIHFYNDNLKNQTHSSHQQFTEDQSRNSIDNSLNNQINNISENNHFTENIENRDSQIQFLNENEIQFWNQLRGSMVDQMVKLRVKWNQWKEEKILFNNFQSLDKNQNDFRRSISHSKNNYFSMNRDEV